MTGHKKRRLSSRICSILLAIAMVVTMTPGVNAEEIRPSLDVPEGEACSHVHDGDCYKRILHCSHEHDADCYDADELASDSNAAPQNCTHEHDESCWDEALDCPHMKGEHDEACGYQQEEGEKGEGEKLEEEMPAEQKEPADRLHTPCQDEMESYEYFSQMQENAYALFEAGLTEEYEAAEAELKEHSAVCELCRAYMPVPLDEASLPNPQTKNWGRATWGMSRSDYLKKLNADFNANYAVEIKWGSLKPDKFIIKQTKVQIKATLSDKNYNLSTDNGWKPNDEWGKRHTGTLDFYIFVDKPDYDGKKTILIEVPEGDHTGYEVEVPGLKSVEASDSAPGYKNTIKSITPAEGSLISNSNITDATNGKFTLDYNMEANAEAEATVAVTSGKYNDFEVTIKLTAKGRTEVGISPVSYEGGQTPYDGSEKLGYASIDFTGDMSDSAKEALRNSVTRHYTGTGDTVYDSDTAPTKPGTYSVSLNVDSGLYHGSGTAEFTIGPKELTITGVTATNRDYEKGKTDVEVAGGNLEGILEGDNVSLDATGAVGVMENADAGVDKAVTATGFTLTGDQSAYYTVKQPDDIKVTINKASYTDTENLTAGEVTLKAGQPAGEQGEVDVSMLFKEVPAEAAIIDVETGDLWNLLIDWSVADGKLKYNSKSGLAADTQAKGKVTVSAQNYNDFSVDITFIAAIRQDEVTIAGVRVENKVYDGSPVEAKGTPSFQDKNGASVQVDSNMLQYLYKGRGDTVYEESAEAPSAAGTYTLTVSISSGHPDYKGKMTSDFEITPKELTITGISAVNRDYKGAADKTVALTGGMLTGAVTGDQVSAVIPTAGTMADGNAGLGKAVTVAKPSLAGKDKENYTLAGIAGVTVDISRIPVTVTGNGTLAVSKPYDGTRTALAAHVTGAPEVSGIVAGDNVTVKAVSGEYADGSVGMSKTIALTLELDGAEKENYLLESAAYSFDGAGITKAKASPSDAELAVSNRKEKTYEYDLSALLPALAEGQEWGTVTYAYESRTENSGYMIQDPTVNGSKLLVPIASVDSGKEEKIGEISIKITSTNYEDMTAVIKVSSVNKSALTVKGVAIKGGGGSYTGEKVVVEGTPTAMDGDQEVSITDWVYEWSASDGEKLEGPPKDAGDYKLTISVPESNGAYAGKQEISFTIAKASLTVKPESLTINKGEPLPQSIKVTYEGLKGSDNGNDIVSLESGSLDIEIRNADDTGVLLDSNMPGTYKIRFKDTPQFNKVRNYDIASMEGTLTIAEKKKLTVTGVSLDGFTGNAGGYTGKSVEISGTPTATDGENEVPITDWVYEWSASDGKKLDGPPKDAGDYKLTISVPESNGAYAGKQEISFTIAKASLTVKPESLTINKGEPLPQSIKVTYEGLKGSDNGNDIVSLESGSLDIEIRNADDTGVLLDSNMPGTYKIRFKDTPQFNKVRNYVISPMNGMLTIVGRTSSGGDSNDGSDSGAFTGHVSLPKNYQGNTKVIQNVKVPDYTVEGAWEHREDGKWKLTSQDGSYYTNCWVPAFNPYADLNKGQNAFDWFLFDENGNLVSGWFTDANGDTYYLNPMTDNTQGAMAVGWNLIDGKYYYFNEESDGTRGRLLKNTVTPDGYRVDENGARIE